MTTTCKLVEEDRTILELTARLHCVSYKRSKRIDVFQIATLIFVGYISSPEEKKAFILFF
jgi:hypothetical protein